MGYGKNQEYNSFANIHCCAETSTIGRFEFHSTENVAMTN